MTKTDAITFAKQWADKAGEDVYVMGCKTLRYTCDLKSNYDKYRVKRRIIFTAKPGN